ncbi:MAG: EAL domain-containing protein [Acidimicrobiia bacterium]|nr:EAL domain-containing protein [Acidimicrobiia bacterium]
MESRGTSIGGSAFLATGLIVVGCSLIGVHQAQRLGDVTAIAVALNAVMIVAALVAAVTLTELADAFDDDGLRWMAWGFGVVTAALVLLALTFPSYAEGGGVFGTNRAGHALLAIAARIALPLFAILAVTSASATRLRRTLGVGFVALFVLAVLVVPDGDIFVSDDGAFRAPTRVLLVVPAVLFAGAVAAWAGGRRRALRPVTWWIVVGLFVGFWASVEWALVDGDLTNAWWGGQMATAAIVVVPAAGMLAAVLSVSRSARAGEERILEYLQSESTTADDELADDELVDDDNEQRTPRVDPLIGLGDFERAFATDAPRLVYQPIVDLTAGEMVAVEALSRFDVAPAHPPNVWFDAARHHGRGVQLELRAMVNALADLDAFPPRVALAVNASPRTLADPRFSAVLGAVDVSRLIVEITEHQAIEDYVVLKDSIRDLRARGMRIAIDDAGSGHAGLRHLVGVVPDIIKLDMSLTHSIDQDVVRSLAQSLTAFARSVGAIVVGEGIETDEQRARLVAVGVQLGQGFRICRPVPLTELRDVPRPLGASPEFSERNGARRPPPAS